MEAYGYVRVSGKSQVDGDGFGRQEGVIADYAAKYDVNVVRVYREEAVSGTAEHHMRPAFTAMVADMLSNGVRTIIVEGMDRLAREYRIQETLLIYLASKGITLISARTEEDVTAALTSDPMRRALVQIQGVFAELEKGLLVKKLRHAREAKKKATGKCEGRKGYAELNPSVLQVAKNLRSDGASNDFIAEILNTSSLTLLGKAWTANNVRMMLRRNAKVVDKQ